MTQRWPLVRLVADYGTALPCPLGCIGSLGAALSVHPIVVA